MANNHDTPISPTQILDPYPERPTRAAGVRQPADLAVTDANTQLILGSQTTPTAFAASLTHGQQMTRVGRWPLASILLASVAHTILAAAMSAGRVPIGIGVASALAVLVCSLLLIAAQCLSIAGQR